MGLSNYSFCDTTVLLYATANYGYHFSMWNDGDTNNPRTVTLTQDTIFTALFAKNQYTLTLLCNDESLGDIGGDGTYDYLDTASITATSRAEHYHFVLWNDGIRDNPRQVVIASDTSFTAIFAIDTHIVNVATNDIARGMVEASGTEFVYGTPCTVTATAYTGYTFAGWSNGVTANPYTFAVMSDVELTAIFTAPGEEAYTVTVESADTMMGSATVNDNVAATVMSGETVTLTATANTGYHFLRWNDNNTEDTRTVTVTADMSFTAYFESDSTEGIEDVGGQSLSFRVYAVEGRIIVEGAEGETVRVYDVMGREVTAGGTPALPGGVYLVKVGNHPARKVVVLR